EWGELAAAVLPRAGRRRVSPRLWSWLYRLAIPVPKSETDFSTPLVPPLQAPQNPTPRARRRSEVRGLPKTGEAKADAATPEVADRRETASSGRTGSRGRLLNSRAPAGV